MPTPFQHLIYARQVLADEALPAELRVRLQGSLGAYLLGNTAVDVQSLTGGSRASTHFYYLSTLGSPSACEALLAAIPALATPARLSPPHAAFFSGYLIHLAYDEVWARDIFLPFYCDAAGWPDRLSYSIHHNAVRVLLDRQAQSQLSAWPEVTGLLRAVHPKGWLPFVDDLALERWRDWLVTQIEHMASQTTQVFAQRMGISLEQLDSLATCIEEGRCAVPAGLLEALASYECAARRRAIRDLCRYWEISAPELICSEAQELSASISG